MKLTALIFISLVSTIAARPEPEADWLGIGAWFDKAGKDTQNWVEGAAKDTENWVGGAVKDTEKWVGGAVKDTEKWVNQAGKDTEKWVVTAADDTKNWVEGAVKDSKNWIEGAAKDTENWFVTAGKDTERWVTGAFKDTKDWFEGAAADTKNWFEKAYSDTEAWIQGAIRDTKEWFNNIKDKLVNFYEKNIKPIIDDFVDIFNKAKEIYEFVKVRIERGFREQDRLEVRNKIKEVFTEITARADKHFHNIIQKLEDAIKEKMSQVVDLGAKITASITTKVSEDCRDNINTDIQNYKAAFLPKLQVCIDDAKKELTTAYNLIKDLVLDLPDSVFDVVEVISVCVEEIQKTNKWGCLLDAGAQVVGTVVEVVADVGTFKNLLVKAGKKIKNSGNCVVNAVKDTVKDKEQLVDHLTDCGLEASMDLLM